MRNVNTYQTLVNAASIAFILHWMQLKLFQFRIPINSYIYFTTLLDWIPVFYDVQS